MDRTGHQGSGKDGEHGRDCNRPLAAEAVTDNFNQNRTNKGSGLEKSIHRGDELGRIGSGGQFEIYDKGGLS